MDRFFCRECGNAVVWRVHRWTHTEAADDHAITLAKITSEAVDSSEPVFVDRSKMIGEPLERLNNIGTTGSLDGLNDKQFTNPKWVKLRILIDQCWELMGGKPWIG